MIRKRFVPPNIAANLSPIGSPLMQGMADMSPVLPYKTTGNILPNRSDLLYYGKPVADIIGVVPFLYAAGGVGAPTYYVSPDGDDTAAGTSVEAAWKNPERAVLDLNAGDVLAGLGVQSAPVRGVVKPLNNITFTGDDAVSYISPASDVSEGGISTNWRKDFFSEWDALNVPANFSPVGIVTQESTGVAIGEYCCKISGTGSYIRNNPICPPARFRLTFIYRSDAGEKLGYVIKNGGQYWNGSGWQVAPSTQTFPSSDTWTIGVTGWIEPYVGNAGTFRFDIKPESTGAVYLNGVTQEFLHEWEDLGDSLYGVGFESTTEGEDAKNLLKSTAEEWNTNGPDTLEYVDNATVTVSLTEIASGEWFYDRAGTYGNFQTLYYKLKESEVLSDLHFEVISHLSAMETNGVSSTFNSIYTFGNYIGCYHRISGSIAHYNVQSKHNSMFGSYIEGAVVANLYDVDFAYDYGLDGLKGGGIVTVGTSEVNCHRVSASFSQDDGFQPGESSNMKMFSCIAFKNLGSQVEPSCTTGSLEMYNCVLYEDDTARSVGLFDNNSANSIYRNNIIYKSSLNNNKVVAVGASSNITQSNNLVFDASGTYNMDGLFDGNVIIDDPLFVDTESENFRLKSASPCINTGVDPFSGGDGDQYDADGFMVWNDNFDAPAYHWRDGVDIGAYAFGGSAKVKNTPEIISGSSMADYVLKWPICPTLSAADDGTLYTAYVPNEIDLATFVDLDWMRFGTKSGVIYKVDQDTEAKAKIDEVIGN